MLVTETAKTLPPTLPRYYGITLKCWMRFTAPSGKCEGQLPVDFGPTNSASGLLL
jgi:hypothetical protein